MKYIAQKDQVPAWLAKIAEKYTMLAPKAIAKSVTYKEYSADEIAKADMNEILDYTTTSMKKAYIPESEVLFSYKSTKKEENLSQVDTALTCEYNTTQRVIFGARPCDAKAVEVQDAAYLKGKYRDPYYAAHRENTFIIAQACNETLPSCFCNWTNTDLTTAYTADVFFTATEKGLVFEAITEKGKELLELASFANADDDAVKAVEAAHAKAHETLPEKPDMSKISQICSFNFENKDFWAQVTAGCIGCSSCTFVCPTCQCFTITDEGNPLEGKRIRSWATCMGDEFTREASGHNPRAQGLMRWRNRLGHKFSYMTSWHEDLYSCTGCGRCLLSCPASISIKDMISGIINATPDDANLPPSRCKISAEKKAEAPVAAPAPTSEEVAKSAPKAQPKTAVKKAPNKKQG